MEWLQIGIVKTVRLFLQVGSLLVVEEVLGYKSLPLLLQVAQLQALQHLSQPHLSKELLPEVSYLSAAVREV